MFKSKVEIPKLYETENQEVKQIYVKFINARTHMEWYVAEYDGKDTFFGYVFNYDCSEWGYFSYSELMSCSCFEDKSFKPCSFDEIKFNQYY